MKWKYSCLVKAKYIVPYISKEQCKLYISFCCCVYAANYIKLHSNCFHIRGNVTFYFTLLFEFHVFIFFDRYFGINWKGKNCRRGNLARDHCHHLFVVIEFRSNKIYCTTNDPFFPVCPTNYYNILIVDWFLPLQMFERTNFQRRALSNPQKW